MTVNCDEINFSQDGVAELDGWMMQLFDSVAVCQCGGVIEPDGHHCPECGSLNPFLVCGII